MKQIFYNCLSTFSNQVEVVLSFSKDKDLRNNLRTTSSNAYKAAEADSNFLPDTINSSADVLDIGDKLPIMHKLCRQVSIESPGAVVKNCVFNYFVPIEDTPTHGARIKIVCAGACYRRRDRSISVSSMSSVASDLSDYCPPVMPQQSSSSPAHTGVREGALFPGFEVAGVIESLGSAVTSENNNGLQIGQRVIVYPFDETPAGYAELMVVPNLKYIVPIPDNLSISIAAMLPTGALLAMNAVLKAHEVITEMLQERSLCVDENKKWKILIVGTGGLALWAVRIAAYHLASTGANNYIDVTVASLRDEGFRLAQEIKNISVVQWNECLYEPQLIERTQNMCGGPVDVVIDFGTTSRSLHRSMHCLSKGGVVLIREEVADKLLPKFSRRSTEYQQRIIPISTGSVEQLHDLVNLVAENKIEPPPHSVFPCEEAADVIEKLCNSEIPGRAILRFHDIE